MPHEAMVDVEIVLTDKFQGRNNLALDQLRSAGVEVEDLDDDDGVVEGTMRAALLPAIQKLDCVSYVRTIFEYQTSIDEPYDDEAEAR